MHGQQNIKSRLRFFFKRLNNAFVCISSVTHSRAVELTSSNSAFCILEKLAVTLLVQNLLASYYAKRIYVNFTTFTRAPDQLYSILMFN